MGAAPQGVAPFVLCIKIGATSPYTGLCGCSMEQPYRDNVLIIKSVGMLPGTSAEYTSLSMNVQHIKNTGCIN